MFSRVVVHKLYIPWEHWFLEEEEELNSGTKRFEIDGISKLMLN